MQHGLRWIEVGNRHELRTADGELLELEIEHDGRCVHFDFTRQNNCSLKNLVRRSFGLKPIFPPKVIESAYRVSEIGRVRERVVKYINEVEKQHLDPSSRQATKRDIVRAFRERYPHVKTRD